MDSNPQTRLPRSSPDEMFPVLSPEQQARVSTQGRSRKASPGEILVELNQQPTKVFVVVAGKLEAVRVRDNTDEVFAIRGPGMFTGELNLLSGRRALARIRAAEVSELIEVEREVLLNLLQTDSALSDIFLPAYILRRVELIARGRSPNILLIPVTSSVEHLSENLKAATLELPPEIIASLETMNETPEAIAAHSTLK
jgi:thioredoxin reductase (NADPH)